MDGQMLIVGRLEDGDTNLKPVRFIHPKHGEAMTYLVGDKHVYEMQIMEDKDHCSLFVDNYVSESNKVFLVNVIDPHFLLIPSLLKNRTKSNVSEKYCSSPINQLLNNDQIKHILSKTKDLTQICTVQNIDDEIFCVLDDDKVVKFLDLKLKNIQNALQPISIDALHDALAVLNEYICSYFFDLLCAKYKFWTFYMLI